MNKIFNSVISFDILYDINIIGRYRSSTNSMDLNNSVEDGWTWCE